MADARVRDALVELVRLHDMEDSHDQPPQGWANYLAEMRAAWEAARDALSQLPAVPQQTWPADPNYHDPHPPLGEVPVNLRDATADDYLRGYRHGRDFECDSWKRNLAAAPAVPQGRVIPREPVGYRYQPKGAAPDRWGYEHGKAPTFHEPDNWIILPLYDAAPVVDPPLPPAAQTIAEWLETDAGMGALAEGLRKSEEACVLLDEARKLTPEQMNTPCGGTTGDERRDSPDPTDGAAKSHGAAATRRRER